MSESIPYIWLAAPFRARLRVLDLEIWQAAPFDRVPYFVAGHRSVLIADSMLCLGHLSGKMTNTELQEAAEKSLNEVQKRCTKVRWCPDPSVAFFL